jgi:hypothetical protein
LVILTVGSAAATAGMFLLAPALWVWTGLWALALLCWVVMIGAVVLADVSVSALQCIVTVETFTRMGGEVPR